MADVRIRTRNGYLLTQVECLMCRWVNGNGDRSSTLHSGVVHGRMLRPGHVVVTTVLDGVRLR